jgi:hypothetical protein
VKDTIMTDKLKREARARAAATGESYTRARRAVACGAGSRVRVIEPAEPSPPDLWHHWGAQRWGIAERDGAGYTITVAGRQADALAPELDGVRIRVDYTVPGTWEPAVAELPPAVWECAGRWLWAATGWAVDDPGDIADMPARPASSLEPFEVRTFDAGPASQTFGVDYIGSPPEWIRFAWCATEAQARRLAEACVRWADDVDHCIRAQVWGPRPDGDRAIIMTARPHAGDRPRAPLAPFGAIQGTRPTSPPPALAPVWPDSRPGPGEDRPDYHLRVWSPGGGWEDAGWFTMRQHAAVAASVLCVGAPGQPWPFGEIWGPDWQEHHPEIGRVLTDLLPDRTNAEWEALTA